MKSYKFAKIVQLYLHEYEVLSYDNQFHMRSVHEFLNHLYLVRCQTKKQ